MSHPVDIHVGNRLRELRVLRGLTQTDIAKGLNISFQQVQKYELGRNRISASRIYDIAGILNVPPSFFFEKLDCPREVEDIAPQSPEEAALLANFRALDKSTRAAVSNILDAAARAQEAQPTEVAA